MAGFVRAPAFRLTVEGEPAPALEADLLHLDVRHDREGLSTFEATFRCWGSLDPAEPPGLLHMGGATLGLGRSLSVELGDRAGLFLVFSGWVSSVETRFRQNAVPELLVRAEDALLRARSGQRTRLHEGSDGDLVRRLAADQGMTADVDVEGATHEGLLQLHQSDLALLRERARAADARLAAVDGALLFRADGPSTEPAVPLSTLGDLVEFSVNADLAHQRTGVAVHGWSVEDKAPLHALVGDEVLAAEAPVGATGPALLASLGVRSVEQHSLEFPATAAEAEGLATAMMRQRGRRFLVARGSTRGTPNLRLGGDVDIIDAGPWFTGRYRVTALRHVYSASTGLKTSFEAERAAIGGGL